MKTYEGRRLEDGVNVTVDGRPLPPRFDVRNHSPSGFEWGYGGSGPAQLAFAILADAVGEKRAERSYQDFKFRVVGRLPECAWSLTESEIRSHLLAILRERRTQKSPMR